MSGPVTEDKVPTSSQMDKVLAYLPIFERSDFSAGDWVQEEGHLAWFAYNSDVSAFVDDLYEGDFIVQFDWPSWQEEALRLFEHQGLLETSDLLTIRRLLTLHVRKNRFSEGHLAAMFEQGHIIAILRRLKSLRVTSIDGGGP